MGKYVALLRGINVGGKNSLPMAELARMFEVAGCKGVRHYIQSGNILFNASSALATRLPRIVAAAIVERFGFSAPLQLRSQAQLAAAVARNPFISPGCEEKELFIMFLASK